MGSTATDGGSTAGPRRGGWLAPFLGRRAAADGERFAPRGERPFRLVDAGHPIPPGAVVSRVVSGDADIRAARWPAPDRAGPALGTVLICTGRSEFIEKYLVVVAELRARGFAVVVFDWRGQGLSRRPLGDAHKGHVDRFSDYEGDLFAVVEQVMEPFCPRPWYGLAHSMGGAIALNAAADHPDLFRRLVLSAPMVEIARLPFAGTARAVARLCRYGGLATSFVPGGRGRSLLFRAFESNLLTSDPARYRISLDHMRVEPRLVLGAPTLGWLHAAFGAMARLHAADYPERMRTPVLAVVPGADRVVEPRATERLVSRLRASRVVAVPGSRHEILMERDMFRQQFWAAFDAFVPGTG
ncbi:alpha/beta hydrolase [Lichenibacterium minor]|uniref:Alpha/beta hydrolase n=1 Tax=Lichenibacterium minor TaxID=2316528 RepID=A0A4Q2UB14_9HYPH|nr:alpha/beta hydrolase [Lichenibacterium minor]RYC32411.1 alpha/beta hydrolase [Lichenibacterium minor]